jgi:hypothetical protein
MRTRDLGIVIGNGRPGPHNAITDVAGVRVGHTTLISGDGPLVVGEGPVRTGVTVITAHDRDTWAEPVFAGTATMNGNGELTGLEWVREAGLLSGPIGITNTSDVGKVRDALVTSADASHDPMAVHWSLRQGWFSIRRRSARNLPGMLAQRPGEIEKTNGYRGPQLDDDVRALRRRWISAGMRSRPPRGGHR